MAEANEVLRVGGLEVVDRFGNVRVRVGYLGEGHEEVWGVAVRDGRADRVALSVDGQAASVQVSYDGNDVAVLGVDAWGEPRLWMDDGG